MGLADSVFCPGGHSVDTCIFRRLIGNVVDLAILGILGMSVVVPIYPMLRLFNQPSARLNECITHTRKVFRLFGYLEGREEFCLM